MIEHTAGTKLELKINTNKAEKTMGELLSDVEVLKLALIDMRQASERATRSLRSFIKACDDIEIDFTKEKNNDA